MEPLVFYCYCSEYVMHLECYCNGHVMFLIYCFNQCPHKCIQCYLLSVIQCYLYLITVLYSHIFVFYMSNMLNTVICTYNMLIFRLLDNYSLFIHLSVLSFTVGFFFIYLNVY